jgi:hypothetical protein
MMRTKLFNRDSQDNPENRLMPILTGMSEEERVSQTCRLGQVSTRPTWASRMIRFDRSKQR